MHWICRLFPWFHLNNIKSPMNMDIFPFRFWFFSAVFCTFQGTSVFLVRFSPKYFILFNPIINQIVFLIYFPYCSLLVYRNVTHFCGLILYPINLLNSFYLFSQFFFVCVVFKGFQHIRACHLQTEIFLVLPSQFRFFSFVQLLWLQLPVAC